MTTITAPVYVQDEGITVLQAKFKYAKEGKQELRRQFQEKFNVNKATFYKIIKRSPDELKTLQYDRLVFLASFFNVPIHQLYQIYDNSAH